jgi:multidrug efflux system membrane fusion protein
VDGILQTRTVQTGQYVQPGAVLATMVRRDPLLLRFQVPESDAARLFNGMDAHFKVKTSTKDFTAKIRNIAAQANTQSRLVEVTAEIASGNELIPGTFAEISVPIGQVTAPVIPQTAVRPSERGFLAYVIEDGKAKERVLTLGMRTTDGRVEVREGVKPGEKLVVRGAEALKDGSAVRVQGEAPTKLGEDGAPKQKARGG